MQHGKNKILSMTYMLGITKIPVE